MSAVLAQIGLVALGGAIGAVARFGVTGVVAGSLVGPDDVPRFPWGVLAVNLVGCFFIGVIAAACIERPADDRLRMLLIAGFLGSFTTFSAFGLDTLELLKADAAGLALANIAGSVVGGTALAAAGWAITQRIIES
ncbi:MAG: fluoride efflux transporter CrcB [Planctomycetota bacterium]